MTDAPEKIWAWNTANCDGDWTIAEGQGIEYTRADIAIKVKPLVWELVSRHPHRYKSECGGYKVYDSGHDGIAFGYRSDDPCGFTYTYHFDQGSGAFDAAQAHHDALILSALVTQGEE
tara:strand:- start:1969 stop:2322 length:354 start_codon:yes stop_codon:yes gene_type:complete